MVNFLVQKYFFLNPKKKFWIDIHLRNNYLYLDSFSVQEKKFFFNQFPFEKNKSIFKKKNISVQEKYFFWIFFLKKRKKRSQFLFLYKLFFSEIEIDPKIIFAAKKSCGT